MNEPLVSVIIPTRNRRQLVERTLKCVLGQRGPTELTGFSPDSLEAVVVDEASEDDTTKFLDDLMTRDPRVRVVRHAVAQGVACARNAGLAYARGRWVAFCDDDDLWAPGKIAAQFRALEMATHARWSAVGSVIVDDRLRIHVAEHVPVVAASAGGGDVGRALLHINAIPGGGSGVLAETALVRSLGGFDPALRNLADWDMWIRLALASPLAGIDAPLMAYHWHGGGMSRGLTDIDDELAYVAAKYVEHRVDAAVAMGWEPMYRWIALMHLLSHRRRAAAAAYMKAGRARANSWRAGGAVSSAAPFVGRTVLSLAAAVWPGLHAIRRAQHLRREPGGWLSGARSWLVEVGR